MKDEAPGREFKVQERKCKHEDKSNACSLFTTGADYFHPGPLQLQYFFCVCVGGGGGGP